MLMAQSDDLPLVTPKRSKSSKRRRRLVAAVVVILVAAVGYLWLRHRRQAAAEGGEVRTAQVTRGDLVQKISSSGVVAAETGGQVKIGSQITGRIRRLYADVGDIVQAGQVIAELDAPDLSANLESARRNYAAAAARYQQQLAGIGMQHTQVTAALEQASQAVRSAEARLEQAKASYASAQSNLEGAQAALEGALARKRSAESRVRSAKAAATLQGTQTTTGVFSAQAALATAQANLERVTKSADLEVASAEAALKQAEANAALAASNLQRQESLLAKGFVAPSEVDNARTQRDVTQQQVEAARNTLSTTQAKTEADLQAARDSVKQAEAALEAAKAQTYQDAIRSEDVQAAEAALQDATSAVTQAQMQVESAKAQVATARAQVTGAESDLRSARAAEKTALGNLSQDAVKQQEVKAALAAMQQAQAQVANQEAQFQKSYIRTPITGTVISLTQQEGETVAAGLSAPTLIEVAALDRLEVLAYVDETDIGKVKLGQRATVTVDAFPDKPLSGQITKIASAATMQQNVVTYPATVKLDEYPIGLLKPQMTADVEFVISEKKDVLLVPTEAVKQKREGTQVVVLKDGKPEVRTVEAGLASEGQTEIISGLSEGETVVLAGFEKLGLQEFRSAAQLPRFGPFGPMGGPPRGGGRRGGGMP
jgi:HlyD family secretion protein